jgi:hypothetical protein
MDSTSKFASQSPFARKLLKGGPKVWIGAIFIFLMMVGGAAAMYLVNINQDLRQQASGGTSPAEIPVQVPTSRPTAAPTSVFANVTGAAGGVGGTPTKGPSVSPTKAAGVSPTKSPFAGVTAGAQGGVVIPTVKPTCLIGAFGTCIVNNPFPNPTAKPTVKPTQKPNPTDSPFFGVTAGAGAATPKPTTKPTVKPTAVPTKQTVVIVIKATGTPKPSPSTSALPGVTAGAGVGGVVTPAPTAKPTCLVGVFGICIVNNPFPNPTAVPTAKPTTKPTGTVAGNPVTPRPTTNPSGSPFANVTASAGVGGGVTPVPTTKPTCLIGAFGVCIVNNPFPNPTAKPTAKPTANPSGPFANVTASAGVGGGVTPVPTTKPTCLIGVFGICIVNNPFPNPTAVPTAKPTLPKVSPTLKPSISPTKLPTKIPTPRLTVTVSPTHSPIGVGKDCTEVQQNKTNNYCSNTTLGSCLKCVFDSTGRGKGVAVPDSECKGLPCAVDNINNDPTKHKCGEESEGVGGQVAVGEVACFDSEKVAKNCKKCIWDENARVPRYVEDDTGGCFKKGLVCGVQPSPTAIPKATATPRPIAAATAAPTTPPFANVTAGAGVGGIVTPAPTAKPTCLVGAFGICIVSNPFTPAPTAVPTAKPTLKPNTTGAPLANITASAGGGVVTPAPTAKPTCLVGVFGICIVNNPFVPAPTTAPTAKPTTKPTAKPTVNPSGSPFANVTAGVGTGIAVVSPTKTPSVAPTQAASVTTELFCPTLSGRGCQGNTVVSCTGPLGKRVVVRVPCAGACKEDFWGNPSCVSVVTPTPKPNPSGSPFANVTGGVGGGIVTTPTKSPVIVVTGAGGVGGAASPTPKPTQWCDFASASKCPIGTKCSSLLFGKCEQIVTPTPKPGSPTTAPFPAVTAGAGVGGPISPTPKPTCLLGAFGFCIINNPFTPTPTAQPANPSGSPFVNITGSSGGGVNTPTNSPFANVTAGAGAAANPTNQPFPAVTANAGTGMVPVPTIEKCNRIFQNCSEGNTCTFGPGQIFTGQCSPTQKKDNGVSLVRPTDSPLANITGGAGAGVNPTNQPFPVVTGSAGVGQTITPTPTPPCLLGAFGFCIIRNPFVSVPTDSSGSPFANVTAGAGAAVNPTNQPFPAVTGGVGAGLNVTPTTRPTIVPFPTRTLERPADGGGRCALSTWSYCSGTNNNSLYTCTPVSWAFNGCGANKHCQETTNFGVTTAECVPN